jgi:hypothetical protein
MDVLMERSDQSSLLSYINNIANNRGHEVDYYAQICSTCDTGLNKRMVTVIIELLENNVDPNSIVDMIIELRKMKSSA